MDSEKEPIDAENTQRSRYSKGGATVTLTLS